MQFEEFVLERPNEQATSPRLNSDKTFKIEDFPGGPVVKTPGFHCRGCGFYPWWGKLCMPWGVGPPPTLNVLYPWTLCLCISSGFFHLLLLI